MAVSKNRQFAKIANDVTSDGTLSAAAISSDVNLGGATVHATRASLPTANNTAGDQAYVTENNRLYVWNGVGWYNVALLNVAPSILSVADSDGGTTPFTLSDLGAITTITITAQDSDGDPVSYTATPDANFNGLATISQADNIFTITPYGVDSATAASGTITFNATDGINVASSGVQTFYLDFTSDLWDETALSIGTSSTNSLNNSTYIDRSSNSHTITLTGTPNQTSFHPYYDIWSVHLPAEASALCYDDTDLIIGTNDFTAEGWFWVDANTLATGTHQGLFDNSRNTAYNFPNGSYSGHVGFWLTTDYYIRVYKNGASPGNSTIALNPGEWNHCALVRSGSTATIYVNGVSGGDFTSFGNNFSLASLSLGTAPYWNTTYQAGPLYVGDFRLEVGTARYTANFTPPTSLESTTDTVFLKSNKNNFNALIGGVETSPIYNVDAETSTFNPFGQGSEYAVGENKGSIEFSSNNQITATGSIVDVGTGDYTVEFWCYGIPNDDIIIDMRNGTSNTTGAMLMSKSTGFRYQSSSTVTTANSPDPAQKQWLHVAVVRSSGNVTYYANGIGELLLAGDTTDFTSTSIAIGASNSGGYDAISGYCSDLKITRSAVYTANFTPPTAPIGNSNASVYLPMDNAGVFDKTGNHILTLVGNTSTSTTQTKYADAAMYFDGSGDGVYVGDQTTLKFLHDKTSDYTIEGWIYPTNVTGRRSILATGAASAEAGALFELSGTSLEYTVYRGVSGSFTNTGTGTVTINQWQHVAVTYDGTTIRVFLDGVLSGSNAWTLAGSANITQITPSIGDGPSPVGDFFGYIENFQILQGVAKYTSAFTPPTEEQGRGYQAES